MKVIRLPWAKCVIVYPESFCEWVVIKMRGWKMHSTCGKKYAFIRYNHRAIHGGSKL